METINKSIAILSGKGGAGKTLVSVNLAAAAKCATYIDCDVEEPNGHLFFKPNNIKKQEISVKIPYVDNALCTGCRECVEFCNYNALAYVGKLIIFDEVCHSCGGCALFCPYKAIAEKDKVIGNIKTGVSDAVDVVSGILNTGEASGVPIIKSLLKNIKKISGLIFIDCPPGSACVVMESIKDADYCILVAEPTIFGAHNLEMAHNLVKLFNKKCGVVLNKCTECDNPSENYCKDNNLDILCKIPYDNNLGNLNSQGLIAVRENNKYLNDFINLLVKVKEAMD